MSVHRKIEKFLRATDMPPTKFGRLAVRDPRFVLDLRRGREPGPRIVARVEAFLAAQQPAQPRQGEAGQ
ncbi:MULTISPECIES: hypothetical protein [unclassified Sphingomonas]|jgi:hypothetical protein|uniref:hypothetical protein n=1 Tax=Sphingomonas TaxID=13687 RepID=UPI000959068E|nr:MULTISPECIES: hypothetical protein [unclassified Sphingomonas]MBN8812455.1 hypothetical protein [Sphingomonas sp.]OJY52215.1 MAG: hypothetical protein BGP17_15500 [Sphingomonas sp. 67-41]